jgi:hypothetical protein
MTNRQGAAPRLARRSSRRGRNADRAGRQLVAVASARIRKQSKPIRQAIARALLGRAEQRTRAAYARVPADEATFNPEEWADEDEALRLPGRGRRS